MFASFLRERTDNRQGSERSPLFAAFSRYRRSLAENEQSASDDDRQHFGDLAGHYDDHDEEEVAHEDEDDDNEQDGPLLPVFSEFLDRLPIYNTTHSIRILVIQRCETTLSWDQLRSPQVSQFLIKPIQQQIRSEYFSRGTIYCLIANSLQFQKEGEVNPGNLGVSKTRALICQLLAMRLLKEFSTRELIDALSYDFDPLQGMSGPVTGTNTPGVNRPRPAPRAARISTVEVAIRAQAKKFLAHPLVVQQLEAIWAGSIVFHSAADNLHRQPRQSFASPRDYGTFNEEPSPGRGPPYRQKLRKRESSQLNRDPLIRRTVTLYDPHDASLFKLSRLRVPRYRALFSTISFAILLALFLAVLAEKNNDITALEVVFWFWSAGFMLDEIVGFSEQGFGLYIMSVWNAFDLGILLMFMVYYVLRLYGILMTESQRTSVAKWAYDVLASTAVLLFPRLFSVLDHSRYFSQLLIAFRMMALDLAAILVLIIISCSGFFVAFTMAFSDNYDAAGAAYALFQLLMGFTPAAWEVWNDYNPLGKGLLTLFMFICHFLIVTILITVLTNSFMAIVQNANEEHQFLFAVNTISMVKSDALFSYIAPTNIIGWLVIPLKFTMPFRRFVRFNRTIIKITHIPVLFSIFVYERIVLSHRAYAPTDLIEQRGRTKSKAPAFTIKGGGDLFSPGTRLREPSITTFRKDRALEEVFRRPFTGPKLGRTDTENSARRNSGNVVRDWMSRMGNEGGASEPLEEAPSVLERLETRRPNMRRAATSQNVHRRARLSPTTRSVASDPDHGFTLKRGRPKPIAEEEDEVDMEDLHQQTDADGDDELVTNDEDDREDEKTTSDHTKRETREMRNIADKESKRNSPYESSEDDLFRTSTTVKPRTPTIPSVASSYKNQEQTPVQSTSYRPKRHNRNLSTNTVLFSPDNAPYEATEDSTSPSKSFHNSRGGSSTPGRIRTDGRRTPGRAPMMANAARARPILPPRQLNRSTPNIAQFLALDSPRKRNPSFNAVALDLASDIGDNRHAPDVNLNNYPASFTTQLENHMASRRRKNRSIDDDGDGSGNDAGMMNRIMLARMTHLEEGFRDMLNEVKGLRTNSSEGMPSKAGSKRSSVVDEVHLPSKRKGKGKKRSENRPEVEIQVARTGSSV